MKRSFQGQATVEFLVVAAALAVALLTPFVQGRSVAEVLLEALIGNLRAQSYLLSIL